MISLQTIKDVVEEVDLENIDKIFDNFPLLLIKLKLVQLQSFIARDGINRLSIFECEAQHVICGVPTGNDVARDEL